MLTISGHFKAVRCRAILLIMLFSICARPASAMSEADQCFTTAESLVQKKKHRQAIPYFDRAIQLAPNICRFYDERGMAYLDLEEDDKAFADFNTVIKLNPKYGFAYRHRARCYFEKGNLPFAIADITTAISFETNNKWYKSELLTDRSTYHLKNKEPGKALADMTESIALTPDIWPRYRARGELYVVLGQYQKAVDDYNKAFEIASQTRKQPYLYGLHGLRARAYEKLGRKDLAAADYAKANEGFIIK